MLKLSSKPDNKSRVSAKANLKLLDKNRRAQRSAGARVQVNVFRQPVRVGLSQEMPPVRDHLQQRSYPNALVILPAEVGLGA